MVSRKNRGLLNQLAICHQLDIHQPATDPLHLITKGLQPRLTNLAVNHPVRDTNQVASRLVQDTNPVANHLAQDTNLPNLVRTDNLVSLLINPANHPTNPVSQPSRLINQVNLASLPNRRHHRTNQAKPTCQANHPVHLTLRQASQALQANRHTNRPNPAISLINQLHRHTSLTSLRLHHLLMGHHRSRKLNLREVTLELPSALHQVTMTTAILLIFMLSPSTAAKR